MAENYSSQLQADVSSITEKIRVKHEGYTTLKAIVKVIPLEFQDLFIKEISNSLSVLGINVAHVNCDANFSPTAIDLFKEMLQQSKKNKHQQFLMDNINRQLFHREITQIINEIWNEHDLILVTWNNVIPSYDSFKVARELRRWIYGTSPNWLIVSDCAFPSLFMGLLNPDGDIDSVAYQLDNVFTMEKEIDLDTSQPPSHMQVFDQKGTLLANTYEAYLHQNIFVFDGDKIKSKTVNFVLFLSDSGGYYIGINFNTAWKVTIAEHEEIEVRYQKRRSLIIRWPDADVKISDMHGVGRLTLDASYKTVYCNPHSPSNPFFAFSLYRDEFVQMKFNLHSSSITYYLASLW